MCFSAAGSFVLAAVLAGAGVASVAEGSSPRQRAFAAIPLIFAAQQACEGVVWLTVDTPSLASVNHLAVIAFLGVALVIWPIWLPFSLWLVERDTVRRRVLAGMLTLGVIDAVYAAILLARSTPVAAVVGHSLRYDHAGGGGMVANGLLLLAYITPTIAPLFVSTMRRTHALGALLVISLVAAILVERAALTSVWCFFAAILSSMVFATVRNARRSGMAERDKPVSLNQGYR